MANGSPFFFAESLEPRRLLSGMIADTIGFQTLTGALAGPGQIDSYTIDLKTPGWILASCVGFSAKMGLSGKGGTLETAQAARATFANESAANHFNAGSYTLKITRLSPAKKDDPGDYSLYALVDHSAGNVGNQPDPTLAQDGGTLGGTQTFRGFVGDSISHERSDFYHFKATAPMVVTTTAIPLSSGSVTIWQEINGKMKALNSGATFNGSPTATATAVVAAGDVYVQPNDNANTDNSDKNTRQLRYRYTLTVESEFFHAPFSLFVGLNHNGGINSNGNLEIRYRVIDVVPQWKTADIAVYWAKGSTEADIIGQPIKRAVISPTLDALQAMDVKIYDLRQAPANATSLLVVLDSTHQLKIPDRSGLAQPVTLGLHGALSAELSDVPTASTRYLAAAGWIKAHASVISKAASHYNIDERAIAGAILWEAIQNVATMKGTLYGPGKPHPWSPDIEAVEGSHYPPGGLYSYGPTTFGIGLRGQALLDPATAINYIAADCNAYAIEAKHAGIAGLRSDPGILDSYYNGAGVTLATVGLRFENDVVQGIKNSSQLTPNPTMGQWVDNNLDYINGAIHG